MRAVMFLFLHFLKSSCSRDRSLGEGLFLLGCGAVPLARGPRFLLRRRQPVRGEPFLGAELWSRLSASCF